MGIFGRGDEDSALKVRGGQVLATQCKGEVGTLGPIHLDTPLPAPAFGFFGYRRLAGSVSEERCVHVR
jgi:hypothetical protein